MRHRTALKNRIHATLITFGHQVPVSDPFSKGGRELLVTSPPGYVLELGPGALETSLDPPIEVVRMDVDINDPAFALAMAERLDEQTGAVTNACVKRIPSPASLSIAGVRIAVSP